MSNGLLEKRRKRLGLTIKSISRITGIPAKVVKCVLLKPDNVKFECVVAIGHLLGVDFPNAKKESVHNVFARRVQEKALYVAKMVQGTQGLEASGVDNSGFQRIVDSATKALMAGKKRKLWDED